MVDFRLTWVSPEDFREIDPRVRGLPTMFALWPMPEADEPIEVIVRRGGLPVDVVNHAGALYEVLNELVNANIASTTPLVQTWMDYDNGPASRLRRKIEADTDRLAKMERVQKAMVAAQRLLNKVRREKR